MNSKHLSIGIIVGLLVLSPALLVGQEEDGLLEDGATPVYEVGDLSPSIGVGFGIGFSPVIYPGVELILSEYNIEDTLPLNFGVAARGYLNFYSTTNFGYTWGYTAFGAGAFGTAHLSFREVDADIEFLKNFDFYAMLGLGFAVFNYTGDEEYWGDLDTFDLFFASIGGTSYFLSESIALMLEGSYWGVGGATLGVRFLLGDGRWSRA